MLTLLIGQCGNQLGHSFFLSLPPSSSFPSRFFTSLAHPRSILIDTEPKVIGSIQSPFSNTEWKESISSNRDDSVPIYQHTMYLACGSGNNFGMGYCVHGPVLYELVERSVRNIWEAVETRITCILILHSFSGGTGSGVGAYITEKIKDEFGLCVINGGVWPLENGEIGVQEYNCMLGLSGIGVSDAVIMLENGRIPGGVTEWNEGMVQELGSVLSTCTSGKGGSEIQINSLVEHLTSHPGFKITSIKTIPQIAKKNKAFNSNSWSYLVKHLFQMQTTNSYIEEGIDWSVSVKKNRIFSLSLCLHDRIRIL